MTDDLLTAILIDPLSDLLRLAYADWIEERGEAERATFIRVQCELAKLEKEPYVSPHDYFLWREKQEALRRREQEILDASSGVPITGIGVPLVASNCVLWEHEVKQLCDCSCVFRRGFIDEIHCSLADWGSVCLACADPMIEYYKKHCVLCDGSGWVGGECQRCRGRGNEQVGSDASYRPHYLTCSHCHGTGRLPGYGKQIVACQPVTRLVITDWLEARDARHGLPVVTQQTISERLLNAARKQAGLPGLAATVC